MNLFNKKLVLNVLISLCNRKEPMEESKNKLYKSKTNKIIDGVCGGLGEYFNIDPMIVRIIFVLLALWGGIGIVLYIIGMIIIPPEGEESIIKSKNKEELKEKIESVAADIKETVKTRKDSNKGEKVLGLILVLVGFILLFNTFFPWASFERLWPLVLVVIGVAILLSGTKKG